MELASVLSLLGCLCTDRCCFTFCTFVLFFPVLPGCERLVALCLLFLFTPGLHCFLLHAHVLWDAQPQKRHANCAQRPHETGEKARFWLSRPFSATSPPPTRFCVCAAEGSSQDGLLPGGGFCSLLAATSSQSYPEENNLWRKWPPPLWTAQVGVRCFVLCDFLQRLL